MPAYSQVAAHQPMIIAGSSFWMPVGVTIFAGGIGALILVVTVLPILYWKLTNTK